MLFTFGRLVSEQRAKGMDEVMEAMPGLLSESPDLVYLIGGGGPDRPRLEAKAKALGLADRVIFAGRIAEEEKVAHYHLADAYVMPSRGEGFGIVILEAMAAGIPAMASSKDGGREALLDGKLGPLVDPDDPASVSSGIRAVLARPRGRPEGLDYFSLEAFASACRDCWTRCVRDASAPNFTSGADRLSRHPSHPVSGAAAAPDRGRAGHLAQGLLSQPHGPEALCRSGLRPGDRLGRAAARRL